MSLPVAAVIPLGNRATNYQSWKHPSTDLSRHRRWSRPFGSQKPQNAEATGHFTDNFSRFCTLLKAAGLLSPPLRQTAGPESPLPIALQQRPRLLALCFVPSCRSRLILPAFPPPPFSKCRRPGGTVPCWQLFRVLKRVVKKFWLVDFFAL